MVSKHRLNGSMKSFKSHLDPKKEENLKGVKIDIENKVARILKLIKSINQGNKENKMKKKLELFQHIEDFHRQYISLYSLYEDLRGEVRKNVNTNDDESSSTSTSDEESTDSPNRSTRNEHPSENLEDDKTTSRVETIDMESQSSFEMSREESRDNLKDLEVQDNQLESERFVQLKDELEGQVSSLNIEIEALFAEKREMEERIDCTMNEAGELRTENSELKALISQLEEKSKEDRDHFLALTKALEENEKQYKSRIEVLAEQANFFEHEMNVLLTQKGQLERRCEEESSQVKDLMERVHFLQNELETKSKEKGELQRRCEEKTSHVEDLMQRLDFLQNELETKSNKKGELELELENKSKEASNYLIQIKTLNEKLTRLQGMVEEKESLNLEVKSLNAKKTNLEEKIVRISNEASQWRVEKDELQKKFSKSQLDASKKEIELNKLKDELDKLQREKNRLNLALETEKENSSIRISSIEKKNLELTKRVEEIKEEHKQQSKSNFLMVERKIEDMAEEFRKQFEDNLRIMSRRIRVAEQLHAENKDCYLKAKEIYEQKVKQLKERFEKTEVGLKNIKELSLVANDVLNSLDTVGFKFEECSAHFLNRISKVSCELKFATDWVKRKNNAEIHLKGDLDCILTQMDEKEAEILVCRERIWKSENKVRELEKMNKHNEDGMLVMQEEKREAIRQLCVWIDYHRSRSDYYKKLLTEVTPRYRRPS